MRVLPYLSAFLIVLFTATANAEPIQPPYQGAIEATEADEILRRLDKNRDGRLGYMEAMIEVEIADKFIERDTNRDGFLSKEELTITKQMSTNRLKVMLTLSSLQHI
ncbi:hypothetical protein [Neptunomonas concharum]|uniref:EF-hand domain-containing protein n=1 Tax=Neptunomonas concharum TaxID=1031538 RepID=A0A5P1RCE8_9GAMM|nr:hypothetical protein [Neptunomonas concharum]QEQ97273.1 hypothetical protein F0U83_11420 [Neptunomonas concharum]